ncbi:MAG TPA: hypothetical protein VIT91_21140 [Chthoniobacterales bacterium]
MSDFHQRGLISTLHSLKPRDLEELETELAGFTTDRPVGLALPCTLDDLRQPAMATILRELRETRYLSTVVICVNRMEAVNLRDARQIVDASGDGRLRLLWADDQRMGELLQEIGVPTDAGGKGLNLWLATGFLLLSGQCKVLVSHDTDIVNYHRRIPALLTLPLTHPEMDYRFAKGYYPRVSGRLYGRVTRLFVAPLLRALVRLNGHHPLLDFLEAFRYPLAGEFGIDMNLAAQLSFSPGWDLEIGMLCEMHRLLPPPLTAQVDLGINYEHKHQELVVEPENPGGLERLASEIAACLLANLQSEGAGLHPAFLSSLPSAYHTAVREMVRRYHDTAVLNELEFDRAGELALGDAFETALGGAGSSTPRRLPSWKSLQRIRPDWCARFLSAADSSAS